MSKHVPDTAAANAALGTEREASRRDHKPYQVRQVLTAIEKKEAN